MHKAFLGLAIVIVLAFDATSIVSAQTATDMNSTLDTLFGSHASYQKFFERLKKAVGTDDKAMVASIVDYPFRTRIDGKSVRIKNVNQFQVNYDKIVTAKVKAAVAKQTYSALFANAEGISVGDGEIWFSGIGNNNTIRITAINN